MRLCRHKLYALSVILAALLWSPSARAVSCTMQSQMKESDRAIYEQAARSIGANIQAANVSAVRNDTIPAVAAQFDSISATIQQATPQIKSATLTVDAL